jgi:hypothetical protein
MVLVLLALLALYITLLQYQCRAGRKSERVKAFLNLNLTFIRRLFRAG